MALEGSEGLPGEGREGAGLLVGVGGAQGEVVAVAGATIWRPQGRPESVRPTGTEAAGWPVKLNG